MSDWIVLGRVSGLFGVRGWVRVFSHTEPREGIVRYNPIFLRRRDEWQPFEIEAGHAHGAGVVLKFAGCDDRDQATALLQADIAVRRAQLPPPEPGEYYWADLEGLRVVTLEPTSRSRTAGVSFERATPPATSPPIGKRSRKRNARRRAPRTTAYSMRFLSPSLLSCVPRN